ncbi:MULTISPECIES: F0F1 ATP synthase subunit B [unclassified Schaalia]|uniref:F0F1 ATP synthase subunit B n=1 Tax=unclassified Schaalia TaxID=2691889 RepID=UPI001E36995B|nr:MULTISPECIES: F0F1 ATP synthase subunit B [unclassified Schaalia]MCD4549647.1 F0F1 ATP synthase subunit B [Schaalia sp. lx-260]MCD4556710.1 F0F1 ATP synthase subunit B [Schaalia sp. lx-100]
MNTLLVAASSHAAGENSVLLPPLFEVFLSAFVLLILVLVVGKYGLPKIYAMLDERARLIEEGLHAADKAKADAAAAERDREDLLRQAAVEAHAVREKATDDARNIIAAARAEASAEAARILDTAQRQILAEKQAAQITLRTDVGLLATELAERIVGEHLADTALTARVVDRFLDDLESRTTVTENI